MVGVVAFFTVGAFIAKFAIVREKTVTAVASAKKIARVKAVFVVVGGGDHVAVFVAPSEVRIFRIFAVAYEDRDVRCLFEEFAELL